MHIGNGPMGVFNFTISKSDECGITKRTSDSDSGPPIIPGTFEKSKKFDYE